ncbi:TPA: helix-turn-helix domain-containing protein [Enterobacter asburiae]
MPYCAVKNKTFSFNNDGSFNQFGLKSVIQEISPKLLRPSEKYILMFASEHATASDKLCIFKSLQTIADDCGVSKDTVRRCLTRCVEMGILTKEFVIDETTGKQKPCLYTYTPLFIRIAKAFRRLADKLKSRRQKDFKDARTRFNTLLERMVFRVKLGLSSLKNKLFSKGYPPKSAVKQGLQNATQEGGKIEPNKVITDKVNKYTATDVSAKRDAAGDQEIQNTERKGKPENGAVRFFQDLAKNLSSIATRRMEEKLKLSKNFALEQKNTKHGKPQAERRAGKATQEGFNHTRFQEADRIAEQQWEERQRIARDNPREKQIQKLAEIRALLDNAKAQKVGI